MYKFQKCALLPPLPPDFPLLKQPFKNAQFWDFPGSPAVKTLSFHWDGHRFDPPGQATKILHAFQGSQKI